MVEAGVSVMQITLVVLSGHSRLIDLKFHFWERLKL